MLKRIVCLLLITIMLIAASAAAAPSVSAEDYSFDERLLYGGTTLDADGYIFFSDPERSGYLFRRASGSSESELIAEENASYLNLFGGRIYFVGDSGVMSCLPDGSGLGDEYPLSGISHLYVCGDGMYFLFGETVYLFSGGETKSVFTREGMKGFIPESESRFRWIKENPDYVYIEETGDDCPAGTENEYYSYLTDLAGNGDEEVAADCLGGATEVNSTTSSYTGPYVQVGNVTLPLSQHMPGTYFSKNGQACTCHNTSSTYCIESVGNCNCMRYYPTGKKETCEVDLLGAQCFAFARMVFYTCFGFIDHTGINPSLFYSVGSLSSGNVTASTVKELLMKAAPGAHVRLAAGHSVSILTMDEDFIVIYHGNAGGDGVTSSPCVVSTRRYTWAQFATAAAKGILYVNMPYNYPDSSLLLTGKETGYYRLNSNLNLRAGSSTQEAILGVVPINSIIRVTEIDGFWGKVSYGGNEGWIFLEYTVFYSRTGITPSGELLTVDEENGFLKGRAWKLDYSAFTEYFDKQNLVVTDKDGNDMQSASGYIGTGCVISIIVGGTTVDSLRVSVTGDVNGNGYVDIGDYIMIRRSILATYELSGEYYAAADIDGNGSVNASDYLAVKRFFLGNMKGM